MNLQESETIELKQSATTDLNKEIVAFVNSNGGTLYIGIADNGTITGVVNADAAIQQISNMVRDGIKPDVTMFLHYETLQLDGKNVISIEVQRGTARPYYLAQKGLRPEGVYVRQGTSSVPASDSAIRRMIKETDGDSFEDMRALEQELTFNQCSDFFAFRNVEFGEQQKRTLGILATDGIYTNLGFLLSDQCMHTVKAATFEGTTQSVFKDRREFTGSLLKQLNDVYDYIDLRNQTHSTIDKLLRVDNRDYPEVAVREALLNALVHRDYSYSASTLINVYEDRLEFLSIGGLVPGVSLEDVMLGLSVCRNPKLANVFYRLHLIEAYGTGLSKILSSYQDAAQKPKIEVTSNAFKITLPNLNSSAAEKSIPSPEEIKLVQTIRTKGSVSRKDVEVLLGIGQTSAGRLLKEMIQKGLLMTDGQGKNTRYILK